MNRRPLIVVGSIAAVLAAAYAVKRLVADPCMRKRLGLNPRDPQPLCEKQIDDTIEDSFPASDPPSYTATAGTGSAR